MKKNIATYSKQAEKTSVYYSPHVHCHVNPAAWSHTRVLYTYKTYYIQPRFEINIHPHKNVIKSGPVDITTEHYLSSLASGIFTFTIIKLTENKLLELTKWSPKIISSLRNKLILWGNEWIILENVFVDLGGITNSTIYESPLGTVRPQPWFFLILFPRKKMMTA